MELVYTGLIGLLGIVGLIIGIVVLIKSFREGGVLHGILGIITCGFYTFIWGWIKSRQLQLGKLMLLWTIVIIAQIALPLALGTSVVLKAIPMVQELGLQAGADPQAALNAEKARIAMQNLKQKRTAKKDQQPGPGGNDPVSKATALWKKGKYTNPQQAVTLLNKALQQNPKNAVAYNNRGNAYRELNQLNKAMQDYNKAISLRPKFVKAYNNRGNIYYDQKNYQMAVRDYNQTLTLNPNYRLAYLNRGLAYHQLKKKNLACQDLQKACQMGACAGINWAKQQGICN